MKKEFVTYLTEIGLVSPLIERVEVIYNYYTKYLAFDLDDIFVSEYLTTDGVRTYESLWFFNSEFCFEAKQFIGMDDFDTDIINNKVDYFNVSKRDFDIIENTATEKSRFTLTFTFNNNRISTLKATKQNCINLSGILKKHVMTNLLK